MELTRLALMTPDDVLIAFRRQIYVKLWCGHIEPHEGFIACLRPVRIALAMTHFVANDRPQFPKPRIENRNFTNFKEFCLKIHGFLPGV